MNQSRARSSPAASAAADDTGRGLCARGIAIPPPYTAGPPPPRAFGAARPLIAIVWISANLLLLAVAAFVAYLMSVTVLVEGAGFSWRAWLAAAGARAGATLLAAAALALLLYPLNAFVLGWAHRPEHTRGPRILAAAQTAAVALATLVGALQSLFIHIIYG